MRLATGSATHTGLVRSNNEDSFLLDDEHVLFAVADGVGGHRGGEVASRTAIEALRAAVAAGSPVNEAIVRANQAVIARAAGDDELTGMGTTMTAAVVAGGSRLLIGHVGDSRAYLLHNGELSRLTDDHSLVEELVREGRLTPEQAESHPRRNIVTRALGLDADVEVDLYTVEVASGDRVLLCSDGLTTMVRDRDVERLMRGETDPQRTAEVLVDAANAAGGEDNTTVVIIDILEVEADAPFDPDLLAAPAAAASTGVQPMPPAPEPEPRDLLPSAPRESRGRRVWGALLLFVPLVLVLAIAFGGVGWYARRSYFVGFTPSNQVVIFKGVPGGVLGWDPTIQEKSALTAAQLTQIDHDRVAGGAARGSLSDTQEFVNRLETDVAATSTTTTTTTTLPKPKPTTKATTKPTVKQQAGKPRLYNDPTLTMALAGLARQRRRSELSLGVLVVIIAVGGYILVALADGPKLPPGLGALLAWMLGLYLVAHLAIRRFAPYADGTLLPFAALLNGIGFVTIARLDVGEDPPTDLARVQSVWVAVGIAVFVITLVVVRDVRIFERYRYTVLVIGLAALLLPMAPVVGQTINGARLWVAIGPISFEPSEIAKVMLVAFFAAYLVEKRELLTQGSVRVGRHYLPSFRDLGPLLLAWGVALMVLGYEQDVGTSLLFFGVFAAMLYIATQRGWYLVGTLILLLIGSVVAYHAFGHVQLRVETWLDPWKTATTGGFQITQAQFAFGSGGIGGSGLGLGSPNLIPNASTDFVFAAIGEELGLVGTIGVLAAFMLLVGSAFRIAADATRPFAKLFAAGIATIIGFQAFLIVGGVTRVIPLTGITLPFVSYGGSSLVANFALLAILLRISDDSARAAGAGK